MSSKIADELVAHFEGGVSVLVGTRDAQLRPTALRGAGARVSADRTQLHLFIPVATGARTIANARDNGRIAVTFSRPSDYRSIQVKGRVVDIHDTPAEERAWIERYRRDFGDDLAFVGIARGISARLSVWPSATITMTIESMFDQAPGPNAGKPYEAPR